VQDKREENLKKQITSFKPGQGFGIYLLFGTCLLDFCFIIASIKSTIETFFSYKVREGV
jgi:hypothetical protein